MTATPGTPTTFCPHCGGPVAAQARFCTKCGASLVDDGTPVRPAAATPPATPSPPSRFRVGIRVPKFQLGLGLVVIVAALAIRLWTGGGLPPIPGLSGLAGLGRTSDTAPGLAGTMKLDAAVEVARQSIGPDGGTITVGANGGPIAGLTIDVPKGAYDRAREFKVSYQPIASHTYGKAIRPVGPMVVVENGGGYAAADIRVRIPAQVEAGQFAMAFFFDDRASRLEGLPLLETAADHITVMSRHFSKFFPTAIAETTLLDGTYETGFKPGVDDWEFINNGSYIAPGGHCAGQSISAMWYYTTKRRPDPGANPALFGRFDNNGNAPKSPAILEDDSRAYRLASLVQRDLNWDSWSRDWLVEYAKIDDRLTYLTFAYAIYVTGHPQYVGLKAADGGHAIIAYRVADRAIWVADPNAPGAADRRIVLKDGAFAPFNSMLKATDPPMVFPWIRYMAASAMTDWGRVQARWDEMLAGNPGKGVFPDWRLSRRTFEGGKEVLTPLGDRVETEDLEPVVKVTDGLGYVFYQDGQLVKRDNASWAFGFRTIQLKPGENRIGFWIVGKPAGAQSFEYIDFQWITFVAGPKVTITPNPAKAEPGKEIQFRGDLPNGPKQARWEWDFGDGTTIADGGIAPKHTYAKAGTYDLKVTVHDVTAGKGVAGGSGRAEIGGTPAATAPKGGGWVLVRTAQTGKTNPPGFGSWQASPGVAEVTTPPILDEKVACTTRLTWSAPPQSAGLGEKVQFHMQGNSTVRPGSGECYWVSSTSGRLRTDLVPDTTTNLGLTPAANFSPWPARGAPSRDPIATFPNHDLFKDRAEFDFNVHLRDGNTEATVTYTYEWRAQ